MDLISFAEEFVGSILEDLDNRGGNAEEIFVDRMCAYLAENGAAANVQPSFWQKAAQGIKVNAFSYNEEERKLALFVAAHEMPYDKVRTIGRTEVERSLKRASKFFEFAAEGGLQEYVEESNGDAYDLACLIERVAPTLEHLDLYLLTNSLFKSNDVIDLAVKGVKETHCHVWDIERLYQLVNEMQGVDSFTLAFEQDFGEAIQMMLVPGTPGVESEFDCYVGYIPGLLLAEAYEKYGQRLIERNVRSFLQAKGKVNKGIKETLQSRKQMFIAYNNGISTTAEEAKVSRLLDGQNLFQIDSLTGWQIVNGGQTTASLHSAWQSGIDISGVHVQAKLTVLKAEEEAADDLISKISQYANTQNKIAISDLGANDSFHVDLEKVSRTTWAPDPMGRKSEKKWYYERARGQYLVDLNREQTPARKNKFKAQNPKDQVITKTQFAKYFMTWEQRPHIVSKGNEENFTAFMEFMEETDSQIDTDYFKQAIARALIFTACDKIVKKIDLPGYKANVVAYTVAMLAHAASDKFPLLEIWNKQGLDPKMERLVMEVAKMTWRFLSNPPEQGLNISQWCKKESCWLEFKKQAKDVQRLSPTIA